MARRSVAPLLIGTFILRATSGAGTLILALLLARHHDARQHAMHQTPQQAFVTPTHFAGKHPRPQHPFGVVVRRWYFGFVQEHEPLRDMVAQVSVKTAQIIATALRLGQHPGHQPIFQLGDPAAIPSFR